MTDHAPPLGASMHQFLFFFSPGTLFVKIPQHLICSSFLCWIGFLVFVCHARSYGWILAGIRNIEFSYFLHHFDQYIMSLLPQPLALSQHMLSISYSTDKSRQPDATLPTFRLRLLDRDTPTQLAAPCLTQIVCIGASSIKDAATYAAFTPLRSNKGEKESHHICNKLKILRFPPSVSKHCIHKCGNWFTEILLGGR